MFFFKALMLALISCHAFAYNMPLLQMHRRTTLKLLAGLVSMPVMPLTHMALAEGNDGENNDKGNNPPLTPEQMEEYNRLLKEAERIQSIIDANKKSLIPDDNENGIKKYLREKNKK